MSKKFSTKALRLRAKASRRRQSLKVNAPTFGKKQGLQESNRSVIAAIEAKIKA